MRYPARVFSDLHLGHRASRIADVERLRPLFKGVGTAIFNGDTWEELARPWRARSARMLAELRTLLAEEGCDAVFLPGNHDPGWEGDGYLELAEGRIVITHGDALLRDGAPWKREMLTGREKIERLWAENTGAVDDPVERHKLARTIARSFPSRKHPAGRSLPARAWDAAHPPERAWQMLKTWARQGKYCEIFRDSYFPAAKVLVTGHFHCRGIRNGRTLVCANTGSFVVPGPAGVVDWDGESLVFRKIREGRRGVETFEAAPGRKVF